MPRQALTRAQVDRWLGVKSEKARAKTRRQVTMIARSRAVPPSEKAAYHNLTGAGKSRVKRVFFEASAEDEQELARIVDRVLRQRLSLG